MTRRSNLCYSSAMIDYLVSLLALLLSVLATLSSLRFVFSRQGFYWIIPSLLSLALVAFNLTEFFSQSGDLLLHFVPFTRQYLLLFASAFWYATVIIFRHALKTSSSQRKYKNEQEKNYAEARFIEKTERRAFEKKEKKRAKREFESLVKPEFTEWNEINLPK